MADLCTITVQESDLKVISGTGLGLLRDGAGHAVMLGVDCSSPKWS